MCPRRNPLETVVCQETIMADDKSITEKILSVLRPYSAHWGGTLSRGDLVIPQRDIPRIIHEIIDITRDSAGSRNDAADYDLFQVLNESRHLPSVQDQIDRLKEHFRIVKK